MTPIAYSAEVASARSNGQAIVALESTIITHGMPYPQNVETAQLVEQDVRDAGAVPATIAVLNGVLHVGLDAGQLVNLGQATDVAKLSRADIAACIATGRTGATTVAHELAHTSVTVVAAGAKAILDLNKTYEVLETLGVPVICVGQDKLPAFWSRQSDLDAPLRMDHAQDIAMAHKLPVH